MSHPTEFGFKIWYMWLHSFILLDKIYLRSNLFFLLLNCSISPFYSLVSIVCQSIHFLLHWPCSRHTTPHTRPRHLSKDWTVSCHPGPSSMLVAGRVIVVVVIGVVMMTRGVVAVIRVEVTDVEGDESVLLHAHLHSHDVGRGSCRIKHRKSYEFLVAWHSL